MFNIERSFNKRGSFSFIKRGSFPVIMADSNVMYYVSQVKFSANCLSRAIVSRQEAVEVLSLIHI